MPEETNPLAGSKMNQTSNVAPIMDETLVNPLDSSSSAQAENSDLIKNIVSTETSGGGENILGEAPEVDASLLQEVGPPKSLFLTVLKNLFNLGLLAGVLSVLFFTAQLSDVLEAFAGPVLKKFDIQNVSRELAGSNAEIIKLKTDENFYRYLEIKGYLDKFTYNGDAFAQNFEIALSQTASSTQKKNAVQEMSVLKKSLSDAIKGINEQLKKNISVPLIDPDYQDPTLLEALFADRLKNKFTEMAAAISQNKDDESRRNYRTYLQVINLITNNDLKSLVMKTDFDAMTDQEIHQLIKTLNTRVVNDLSTIQLVKDQRIKWSDIINEIQLRTIAVDSHYSDNFFDALGGIRYNSYDFDTNSKKISIIGETKTFDTANFTMMADLIDELNGSNFFTNGEMRSFSKSGSLDDGYSATLKLSLDLKNKSPEEDKTANIAELPNIQQ